MKRALQALPWPRVGDNYQQQGEMIVHTLLILHIAVENMCKICDFSDVLWSANLLSDYLPTGR